MERMAAIGMLVTKHKELKDRIDVLEAAILDAASKCESVQSTLRRVVRLIEPYDKEVGETAFIAIDQLPDSEKLRDLLTELVAVREEAKDVSARVARFGI
jgi:uncharacterized coiled-coil DUF342 family protein